AELTDSQVEYEPIVAQWQPRGARRVLTEHQREVQEEQRKAGVGHIGVALYNELDRSMSQSQGMDVMYNEDGLGSGREGAGTAAGGAEEPAVEAIPTEEMREEAQGVDGSALGSGEAGASCDTCPTVTTAPISSVGPDPGVSSIAATPPRPTAEEGRGVHEAAGATVARAAADLAMAEAADLPGEPKEPAAEAEVVAGCNACGEPGAGEAPRGQQLQRAEAAAQEERAAMASPLEASTGAVRKVGEAHCEGDTEVRHAGPAQASVDGLTEGGGDDDGERRREREVAEADQDEPEDDDDVVVPSSLPTPRPQGTPPFALRRHSMPAGEVAFRPVERVSSAPAEDVDLDHTKSILKRNATWAPGTTEALDAPGPGIKVRKVVHFYSSMESEEDEASTREHLEEEQAFGPSGGGAPSGHGAAPMAAEEGVSMQGVPEPFLKKLQRRSNGEAAGGRRRLQDAVHELAARSSSSSSVQERPATAEAAGPCTGAMEAVPDSAAATVCGADDKSAQQMEVVLWRGCRDGEAADKGAVENALDRGEGANNILLASLDSICQSCEWDQMTSGQLAVAQRSLAEVTLQVARAMEKCVGHNSSGSLQQD
ncbi:hypothetical protein CYMTET_5388, partial [Cymbomonas tetramitiformis]